MNPTLSNAELFRTSDHFDGTLWSIEERRAPSRSGSYLAFYSTEFYRIPNNTDFLDRHGYVAAALLSTFYLNLYQYLAVARARKAAGIAYPQMYADKAEMAASDAAKTFNYAQRAHGNTLESVPFVLMSTAVAAIEFPKFAAASLGLWSLFRFVYTISYTSGGPTKRNRLMGATGSSISMMSLLLAGTYAAARISFGW
ncbi:hypothetical protein EIP91_004392 [Steccherinum ochraceum]|uniref:Microsomal glutathione S-transferase 3 n=1 Tax=Steccherinum ochraceum TaxID=92696 RepID=A0A4R0RSM1_9APHY|nr:hypothetical protein EIP91_004392 [Steccherinum ochraceum]